MKPGKSHRIRDIWIVASSVHKSLGIWHRIIAQHELVNMGRWKGVMKCPKEKPEQEESQVQQQGSPQATSLSGKSSEALREPPAVSLEQLSPAQSWVLQQTALQLLSSMVSF